jgi:hypothetical protein
MDTFQVHFSSKYATSYTNNKSNCDFYLPNLEINQQNQIYLSVVHAVIPCSFYNINSSNNFLQYTLNGIVQTNLTIAKGNYNINTLTKYLNLNLPLSFTYNAVQNTFTITHPTLNFSFLNSSTCLGLLGFTTDQPSSSGLTLTSSQSINLATIHCICISTNLETNNINMSNGLKNNRNVICSIPIDVAPNSLLIYKPIHNFRVNTFTNIIGNFNIKLEDQNGNQIDLNGLDRSMTIQFDYIVNFVE